MRFELHCHSHYSEGTKIVLEAPQSPRELIRTAKKKGLDGLALTDHDTTKGWKQASEEAKKLKMVFIPAVEISTKSGHVLGLGLNSTIKKGISLDETLDKIKEQGAVSVAAHPFDIRGMGIRTEIRKTDAVEVFNAFSFDKVSNRLTEKHAKRLGLSMTVGSDAHSLGMLGSAVNIINARSLDGILKKIKKGDVLLEKKYVSAEEAIDWSRDRMTKSYLQILNYIEKNYKEPKAWASRHLLNNYVFSTVDNSYWAWRCLAKLGFGASGLYGRAKLWKYY
ncbi:MAG: CehA/McbA family metallohydrolase [Nanoarchaeota archaeon]